MRQSRRCQRHEENEADEGCSPQLAELLVNRARTLIFSTGLPPSCLAAGLEALAVLRNAPELVQRLHRNARLLRSELSAAGFPVRVEEMPIVPLVLGAAQEAMAMCEAALREGVFAQAIRPPTVPEGTARLRLVAMATHSHRDLRHAAATLAATRPQR